LTTEAHSAWTGRRRCFPSIPLGFAKLHVSGVGIRGGRQQIGAALVLQASQQLDVFID
jgi:hypothetical protein